MANRIQKKRLAHGISLADIANFLGVSGRKTKLIIKQIDEGTYSGPYPRKSARRISSAIDRIIDEGLR